MNDASAHLFKRLVFHNVSQSTVLCGALAHVRSTGVKVEAIFSSNESELLSALNDETLVVCSEAPPSDLLQPMRQRGFVFVISSSLFENRALEIFSLVNASNRGCVILAFLSSAQEGELQSLFSLYGFSVFCVHTPVEFTAALKSNVSLVVLDQDMPSALNKRKEVQHRIIEQLKSHRSTNPLFSVAVLKDFNQGSLFDDITSPIKEICNSMLSPEEFFLFARAYLYRFEHEAHHRKLKRLKSGGFFGEKMSFGYYLRDIRRAHEHVFQGEFRDHEKVLEQVLFEMRLDTLRHALTEPMALFLETQDKEKRGSFSFIESSQSAREQLFAKPSQVSPFYGSSFL